MKTFKTWLMFGYVNGYRLDGNNRPGSFHIMIARKNDYPLSGQVSLIKRFAQ